MSEQTETTEPKDLRATIIALNELLLDEAAESASQAFNAGCIISVFAIAIIVILAWIFTHWIGAFLALIVAGLLATSVSALMAMSARSGNIKQTFKNQVEPRLDEICAQFGVDRDEFIVAVYDTLAEESPLAQFFPKPAEESEETDE